MFPHGGKHAPRGHWLSDFLPDDNRLHIYQYPPEIFFGTTPYSLSREAENMLERMAHLAICIAQSKNSTLFKRLRGVVFLGTPHHGSELADPSAVLGNIVSVSYEGTLRTKQLKNMRRNAHRLVELNRDFQESVGTLEVVSFYEAVPTAPLNTIIIDRSAALLQTRGARQVETSVNHIQLCQMAGRDPGHYEKVVKALHDLIASIPIVPIDNTETANIARHGLPDLHFDNKSSTTANQGYTQINGGQNIYFMHVRQMVTPFIC
ncbi:Protein SERAC1 [Pseudocercospora fuligena]|uniref:Protein SERAC1 n=1 Tax=Pseudocercospora fuligena TaxID=685502 RepID=A0A8H6VLT3_9PEZI|nr:Protein SERAC1 [Pseudocercospora fuligena]